MFFAILYLLHYYHLNLQASFTFIVLMMNGLNRSRLAVCRPSLLVLDQLLHFFFFFTIHEMLTHDTRRIM